MATSDLNDLIKQVAVQDIKIFNISKWVEEIKLGIESLSNKYDTYSRQFMEREASLKKDLEYRFELELDALEKRFNDKINGIYSWGIKLVTGILVGLVIYYLTSRR